MQLNREPHWLWLHCANRYCRHSRATPLAPFIIRWGPDASSDKLRKCARCTICGHKGATLMVASWSNEETGYAEFPK